MAGEGHIVFISPQLLTPRPPVPVAAGGGTNNTALDGSATASGVTTAAPTLTTTGTNRVIIMVVTRNGGADGSSGITDTAGLTWTRRAITTGSKLELWSAVAASALSSDVITFTNGGAGFLEAIAFGISGANTSTIFDANGALPALNTTTPVSISTSNANDFLIAGSRNSGNVGPDTGWTQISASASFTLAQYKIVTATQSSLSVADPGTTPSGMIGDAVMST